MDSDDAATTTDSDGASTTSSGEETYQDIRREYEARLLQANLRTEAVRAGMIDLDGLRMIDTTKIKIDNEGNIIDGKGLMQSLQKKKPWLFGSMSSSSTLPTPSSAPVRQKSAMDMSDEEYISARAALVKYTY
jgi:hypothetical protein